MCSGLYTFIRNLLFLVNVTSSGHTSRVLFGSSLQTSNKFTSKTLSRIRDSQPRGIGRVALIKRFTTTRDWPCCSYQKIHNHEGLAVLLLSKDSQPRGIGRVALIKRFTTTRDWPCCSYQKIHNHEGLAVLLLSKDSQPRGIGRVALIKSRLTR